MSDRRFLTLLALAACHTPMTTQKPTTTTTSWPAVDDAFIEQSAKTLHFRLGTPSSIAIAPDGDVLFTRTPPRSFVADLYRRDARTGAIEKILDTETLLGGNEEHLSAEEKARRERLRHATRGIAGFDLSEDGKLLLVPLSDRLFVVDRATGERRQLQTGEGFPFDPELSRQGDRVAYVIDGDLWVTSTDGKGEPVRLTQRPGPDVEFATAEFVAQEEMDRTRGFWWSPDGSMIAYQKSDVSKVDTLYVADPAHPDAAPTPFKYPLAGRPNAEVSLGVMPSRGGAHAKTTWVEWDHDRYPYLCNVVWDEHGPLTLIVMNRAQTELALLAADAHGKTTTLLTETDPAWLNLPTPGLPIWRGDGSGFLWESERSGAWQLELRKADGSLDRTLTPKDFGLRDVAGLDVDDDVAWVTGSADPTQTQVYAIDLKSGAAPRAVTSEAGVHGVGVPRHGGRVILYGTAERGDPTWQLADKDGKVIGEIPSVAEKPPWMPNVEWTTVTADGRDYHASIVRPRNFDPKDRTKKYPVLVSIYAGPSITVVHRAARAYLEDQWFADAGFIVVSIDGRGTPDRGRDWERAVWKDLITIALGDQVAALQALGAKYPELDLARVGIFGWSFGGYASAMAVLMRPDIFKAAVAGAPVTDWSLYDTFYTERYMQTPEENPDGYQRASAIARAGDLTRPLLVIHGTTDDNVHFANSLGLIEAIFRAGKGEYAELLPVEGTHMTPDPVVALALAKRQLAFFRAHL